ncbi:MAG: patatin-like phospholipase family protein [Chloroflexota bacterium]|nr:patatin-like phospholipase family protein [Chloroflexota bacterium]
MGKIGLALGGGGVRGLAHISVLEVLDELDCKPSVIAGTSMGAVIGALYASGMSGKDIKELVRQHIISKDDHFRDVIDKRSGVLKLAGAFTLEHARGGIIKADKFYNHLFGGIDKTTFEDLEIPLIIIATDYWTADEVVFETGELLPAIKASAAVPGVFAPISIEGRILVDGGVVNSVPYEHVMNLCDVTIAVDVAGTHTPRKHEIPSILESILGTFHIMQTAALAAKMKYVQPDIYVRPDIHDVRLLDLNKIEVVFEQAAPAVEELKVQLSQIKFE